VLEDSYGFPVEYERMHMRWHPQLQATKHVVDFLHKHDNIEPRTLLIVYYAGHGGADRASIGRISLSGCHPDNDAARDRSIAWTEVEPTLAKAESDVVVIFDCCHAGLLCRPARRGPSRSFHYVAACKADQTTRASGEKSFTAAMIWALKDLADSPGFTVTRLVQKLMQHEPFPREEQEAVIYTSRFGPGRDIWIAPTPEKRNAGTTSPAADVRPSSAREDLLPTADILDLRFHFAQHATVAHITETARMMKDFLETKQSLHFHHISFIDHTSFVRWGAEHWLDVCRKRKVAREGATPVEQLAFTLVNSEDSANSFDRALLQHPRLDVGGGAHGSPMSMTAVASPVGSASHLFEKEILVEKASVVGGQVLYHLGMAFVLLFADSRPVSAWHHSASVVVL
jgi:hypothetical protein